jgi:hypothetical protein
LIRDLQAGGGCVWAARSKEFVGVYTSVGIDTYLDCRVSKGLDRAKNGRVLHGRRDHGTGLSRSRY